MENKRFVTEKGLPSDRIVQKIDTLSKQISGIEGKLEKLIELIKAKQ